MRILPFALAVSLAWTPAHAQFGGMSTQNGGGANHAPPDLSMCAAAPTTWNNVWHIDPVNGHTAAYWIANPPGSGVVGDAAHPWDSVKAVTTVQTGYTTPLLTSAGGSPIAPGDKVLLHDGTAAQYGIFSVTGINNSSFVTIQAAPGATPVLSNIPVLNSSFFDFEGITVQSPPPNGIVSAQNSGALKVHDIIFNNMLISSASNATAATWTTQAQWASNTSNSMYFHGSLVGSAYCLTMSNSHLFNNQNAATVECDNCALINTEIDHVAADGLDIGGTNVLIKGNYLHDFINVGNGGHSDAMQAFPYRRYNNDILIDGNTIIYQTDPNLPYTTPSTQTYWNDSATVASGGTSGFAVNDKVTMADGTQFHVTAVTSGVITAVTLDFTLVSAYAFNFAAIPANPMTVASTSGAGVGTVTLNRHWAVALFLNGSIGATDSDWTRMDVVNNASSWPGNGIGVQGCHDCLVMGNTSLSATYAIDGFTAQHGGGLGSANPKLAPLSSGVIVRNNICVSCTSADANAIVTNNFTVTGGLAGIQAQLMTFNNTPPTLSYDFHLQSSSTARGFGVNTTPGPLLDISGNNRYPTHDAGAYVYP